MTRTAEPIDFTAEERVRFQAAFEAALGPQPTQDQGLSISIDWVPSPVGPLLLGAKDEAVVLVEFAAGDHLEAQFERLRKHFAAPFEHSPAHPLLTQLRSELAEYFLGARRVFEVPVRYRGSAFQETVWAALRKIPYGETCSYAAIARTLGDPKATRAVGMANGSNPTAIVIPCHRVVNASGELGGYGGGRWRKQLLLDLEQGQGRLF